MNVCLWCAGPSLADAPPPPAGDALVTVNGAWRRAATIPADQRPHWWAVCSEPDGSHGFRTLLRETETRPIALVTHHAQVPLAHHVFGPSVSIVGHEFLRQSRELPLDFSKLLAFGLCLALGAKRVTVFGDDMGGEKYFDGSYCTSRDSRWERERALTDQALTYLAKRNVEVVYR